jgi:electron transport complex protein RnfD
MVFRIASSPYTHNQRQTSRIMMLVCLAALPGIAVQLWFFGWGTLFQILLGCVSALAAEALVLKLRKMAVSKILADNSALLTGLLLAISIPPFAPWWMVVLGTVFSVIIAKQLYGGLGHNPFNPAMIGYVVLLISFPVQMTSWLPPHEIAATVPGFMDALQVIFTGHSASGDINTLRIGVDGISQATPLDTFKTSLHAGHNVEQILQHRPVAHRQRVVKVDVQQAIDVIHVDIFGQMARSLRRGYPFCRVGRELALTHHPVKKAA